MEKGEFKSDRICELCNSQEGKRRKVGNFIVKLSQIRLEERVRLACQSCKIKERNFRKVHQRNQKDQSLFKSFFKAFFL